MSETHTMTPAEIEAARAIPNPTFTPGPWDSEHDKNTPGPLAVFACDGPEYPDLASVHDGPQRLANARLIAAAPDLYAACESAENWLTEFDPIDEGGQGLIEQLRAALARARGDRACGEKE